MTTESVTLPTCDSPVDYLLDLANEVLMGRGDTSAASERRNRAMQRAHEAGLSGCEICGRALKGGSVDVVMPNGEHVGVIGPDCAKKIRKILTLRAKTP